MSDEPLKILTEKDLHAAASSLIVTFYPCKATHLWVPPVLEAFLCARHYTVCNKPRCGSRRWRSRYLVQGRMSHDAKAMYKGYDGKSLFEGCI